MRRREFLGALGGTAVSGPLAARAQQSERVRRVGVLMNQLADDLDAQARLTAFLDGLRQLSWTNGHNVRIDIRWAAGDADRVRKWAAEFAVLAPDVILATGSFGVGPLLRQLALYRSYLWLSPIRSVRASSTAWRGRAVTRPDFCSLNTP